MTITFHCDCCGKKIEAKEEAAGRWGKCPSCHNRVYVPNVSAGNDLKLAPVDEDAEKKKHQLMAETFMLEQEILSERATPETGKDEGPPPAEGFAGLSDDAVDEDAVYDTIVKYLRQMADGKLDEAAELLKSVKSAGETSVKLLDRVALADIPEAELADIPPQVLAGLIRTLRSEIG